MPINDLSDAEIIAESAAVAEAFTPEMYAYLLSLLPTPQAFAELNSRLTANYPAALKGDPEKVKAFEADRNAMNCDLSLIRGLAKVVAVKDATVPESLGLGKKKAAAIAPLTKPQGFKVVYDRQGQLFASVIKVPGAKGYQIWLCDADPSNQANWKLFTSATRCRRMPITGLNRRNLTMLKIRAMRGHVSGPWSNVISLDPI